MKKLKGQLLRWILIVRKLQNQPYISFRELQRELERELAFRGYDPICSDATLKRDLNELKEEFGLDITYSRTHAKLIIQAGIKRVVYAEKYRLEDGLDLLKRANIEVVYLNPNE